MPRVRCADGRRAFLPPDRQLWKMYIAGVQDALAHGETDIISFRDFKKTYRLFVCLPQAPPGDIQLGAPSAAGAATVAPLGLSGQLPGRTADGLPLAGAQLAGMAGAAAAIQVIDPIVADAPLAAKILLPGLNLIGPKSIASAAAALGSAASDVGSFLGGLFGGGPAAPSPTYYAGPTTGGGGSGSRGRALQ